MIGVLRQLLRIGAPPWGRFALAVLLGVAGAMATVGLLAGSGYVVDKAAFRPGLGAIAGLLAAVEVMAFARGPLRYAERLVGHDAAFRSLVRWRVWLYDRLEPLAPAALAGWRSGDLLARATEDVDTVQDLTLRCLLPLAVTSGAAALAVVVTAVTLPAAGAVLAASLAVALVGVPSLALVGASGRQADLRGAVAADVVDLLSAAPDLVAYGAEGPLLARLEAADAELTRLARRRALWSGAASALATVALGAGVTGVLAVGTSAVTSHHLAPVMLGVLALAAVGAFETVPTLAQAALRANEVAAAGRRLLAVVDVTPPVTDPHDPVPAPGGRPSAEVIGGRLRYGPDLPWVLDGVDLALAPGATVGVVGSSGAGKSSLIHVLLRFWMLEEGQARLGGVDLDRLTQADARQMLALVDQDAHVFAGTLRSNIALARPSATDEEVAAAVALAHLDAWVAQLPDGLDTEVGEGGARVSGGERHRIAVARAVLADRPVLVLDEPTAGLDRAAGRRLVADIVAAADGRSVLLVTHRRDELDGFDAVVTLRG